MATNAFGDEIIEAPKAAPRVNSFGDPIVESGAAAPTNTDNEPYRPGAASAPEKPRKKGTILERAVMGAADLATGAGKLGANILAPYDLAADAVQGRPMGTGNRERLQSIEQFGQEKGADDWTSTVNQAAPEMAATAGPMAKVEGAVAKEVAMRMLPRAGKAPLAARAAGVAADIGTNAAYSGAQAAAQGEDPIEAAKNAALISGGVRAGLKVAAAPFNKGASQGVNASARTIQEAGLPVTPGMLYPDTWAAAGERVARNTPFMGSYVEGAEGRLGREYIKRHAQEIVDPLQRVVPGETVVPPRQPRTFQGDEVTPDAPRGLPRATGREVGPSMVEPIPQRGYPQPDDGVLHVDSSGNIGKLTERNPAYDPESGLFHSTQASRPPDAANLPATQVGDVPINPHLTPSVIENPSAAVGPAGTPRPRNFVEGEGRSSYTGPYGPHPYEAGPARSGETLEQRMTLERRAPQVEGEGLDLVRNVQKHIEDSYNDVVDRTFLTPRNGVSALLRANTDLDNIAWLTAKQRKQVKGVINDRLIPRMQGLGPDAVISGREVKNLDSILGEQARNWAEDATTKPMADAMYAIQHRLRVATEGVTPQDRHVLQLSNEAFRKALPLISATEQSLGSTGIPSALQLRRAMEKYNMSPDALNDAMVQVAPNAPTSNQLNRRWIGSGLGLTSLMTGGLPGVAGFAAGAGLAGGTGKVAYSQRGVKLQLALLDAPAKVKAAISKLPYQEQLKYLASYAGQAARSL